MNVKLSKASLLHISTLSLLILFVSQRQPMHEFIPQVQGVINPIPQTTMVKVFIGQSTFKITGLTSPFARVELEGQGIYDETYADANGNFSFNNIFSPLSPREMCLTAFDTDGRFSKPVCLPPFPTNKYVEIGPILLPPTLSASNSKLAVNDYGIMNGRAAPESSIHVVMESNGYVKPVEIDTFSDEHGNFSFSVPTNKEQKINTFAVNSTQNLVSDKSNNVLSRILPLWKILLEYLSVLAKILLLFLLPFLLLLEALYFFFLFKKRHPQKHPLLVRPSRDLLNPREF